MLKVKHFICGASPAALGYLDEDLTKWFKKAQVKEIKRINEVYGQAPLGMSGHGENVLFISIWYEAEDPDSPGDPPHVVGAGEST